MVVPPEPLAQERTARLPWHPTMQLAAPIDPTSRHADFTAVQPLDAEAMKRW